jgi:predicted nucleotidyltransferase component of viral defense system
MKDYLLELVARKTGVNEKLNIMREYTQAYTLRIIHDEGFLRSFAFVGGTALRFLHNLPRFSEDLDFSLAKKESEYSFISLIRKIKDEFILSGYNISISYDDKKTVHSAFLKFEGLLYEAGLAPLKSQKFSIKIEIDTNPPQGAILETEIVNKYFPISFLSYDLASLFAGKLHALLSRKHTKGRDFFDLGWYLSHWRDICPNIVLLHNALKQTGWGRAMPNKDNWRVSLYQVVEKTDWGKVRRDVENFLENSSDINIFSKENVLKLLEKDTKIS